MLRFIRLFILYDSFFMLGKGVKYLEKRTGKALHSVVEYLKQGIASGDYLPGEKLNMLDIAEKLGISRIPVSEAFQDLGKQGLVELINNRGAYVKKYTFQEAYNIYNVWTHLDVLACRLAAQNLNDDHIRKIEKNLREQEGIIEDGDYDSYDRFIIKNHEFHLLIAQFSGNQFLFELIDNILNRVRIIRMLSLGFPTRPPESYREHLMLFKYIKEKEYCLIEKQVHQHMERGFDHIKRKMNNKTSEADGK